MKIDDLIAVLQRVRDAKGNIEVQCNSFCGTNNNIVSFDIKPPNRKKFEPLNYINGLGAFCLSIDISADTRKRIAEETKRMESIGYTFYHSQFVYSFESPKSGLSPCEWHIP